MLSYVLSTSTFLSNFITKMCGILTNYLSESSKAAMLLSFSLFMLCFTFIDLHILNQSCIPERKPVCPVWSSSDVTTTFAYQYYVEISAFVILREIELKFPRCVYLVLESESYCLYRINKIKFLPFLFNGTIWVVSVLDIPGKLGRSQH